MPAKWHALISKMHLRTRKYGTTINPNQSGFNYMYYSYCSYSLDDHDYFSKESSQKQCSLLLSGKLCSHTYMYLHEARYVHCITVMIK